MELIDRSQKYINVDHILILIISKWKRNKYKEYLNAPSLNQIDYS